MPERSFAKKLVPFGPFIAVSAYAFAAIFIRWSAEASPLVIAFYRMFVAAVAVAPFYWMGKRVKPTGRQRKLMGLAGVFLAAHFATWISSILFTTVSSAVFLILTQPMMVAVAAHFIIKERLNRWHLLSFFFTIVGALFIFGGDMELGGSHLFGDILALIGAALAGAYLFIARLARPDSDGHGAGVPLHRYLPPVYGLATVILFLICLINGESFGPFSSETWFALLGLGLIPTVIGHSMFNWSLRYLPALPVNIALVGEPVGASILAFFLFEEIPSGGLLIGSPLLILAVILVFVKPPTSSKY